MPSKRTKQSSKSSSSSRSSRSARKETEQEEKEEADIFSECEAHQLLRELKKEEMTLKSLIYEFSEELKKTKFEEGILRDMIDKLSNGQQAQPPNSKLIADAFMMNNNIAEADDNHNHNHHAPPPTEEEVDGDLMLKELLEDALNTEDIQ